MERVFVFTSTKLRVFIRLGSTGLRPGCNLKNLGLWSLCLHHKLHESKELSKVPQESEENTSRLLYIFRRETSSREVLEKVYGKLDEIQTALVSPGPARRTSECGTIPLNVRAKRSSRCSLGAWACYRPPHKQYMPRPWHLMPISTAATYGTLTKSTRGCPFFCAGPHWGAPRHVLTYR